MVALSKAYGLERRGGGDGVMIEIAIKEAGLNNLGITHHFGGGVYVKETRIPANMRLTQHVHEHDHLSVLVSGEVIVRVDGVLTSHTAPAVLTIASGKAHEVVCLTDTIWMCIHATDETDPEKVDQVLIA